MDTLKLLLELPLGTLALLVGGYVGYRTAYVGRNLSHNAIDTLFRTLAFGLIVRLTYGITDPVMAPHAQALWGVMAAFAAAAIWRVWLCEAWFEFARRIRLNDHDGHRAAWHLLLARGTGTHRAVIVQLKNGTRLMSRDLRTMANMPLGPCLLGEDGSVGLYVTHICRESDPDWVADERAATKTMTFVSAAEITLVDIQWVCLLLRRRRQGGDGLQRHDESNVILARLEGKICPAGRLRRALMHGMDRRVLGRPTATRSTPRGIALAHVMLPCHAPGDDARLKGTFNDSLRTQRLDDSRFCSR